MRKELSIGIIIDQKCNIQCDHCCFSSGPKSTSKLSDDTILQIINEAGQQDEVTAIGISGGEAMLRRPLVLKAIRLIAGNNKKATLTSNGFWGITPVKAAATVEQLLEAGLSHLTISYDDFHSKHLSSDRVKNVLQACQDLGLPCSINAAISRSQDAKGSIARLGKQGRAAKLREFPVTPVGSASKFSSDDFVRNKVDPASLKCPGFEPTFHFDGNIYPCCSPSIFNTSLIIGSVANTSVEKAMNAITHNAYFSVIRNEGFGWLASKAAEFDIIGDAKTVSVVDVCELCSKLASNERFLKSISTELVARAKEIHTKGNQNR